MTTRTRSSSGTTPAAKKASDAPKRPSLRVRTDVKAKATRQSFGEALLECGRRYDNVVVLDADLAKSTKTEIFAKEFPNRFFDMGIAEQNMLGVAAGLALSGKTAFCASFACFVAGRFEVAKISVAYTGANVRIVGTHAGVGIGEDGYSQMGLEDIALMRVLPGMRVYQPSDDLETQQIVEHLCTTPGPAYLRLTRQNVARVHPDDYVFHSGKLDVLADGAHVALFATGGTVEHALRARDLLAADGIDAAIVNVHTLKPFDRESIRPWAIKVMCFVTIEDHNIIGGLGSVISEAVAELGTSTRVIRHGIPDVFGESGTPESLYDKFKLDAEGIASVVKKAMKS